MKLQLTPKEYRRILQMLYLADHVLNGRRQGVLELPEAYDLSQAKAAYLNGFLRIDVPLAQRRLKHTKVPVAEGV